MSLFKDKFVKLTDANDREKAHGRTLCFNADLIVAFYRQEDDPTKTNIFTADGRSYTVLEDVTTVFKRIS